MNDVALTVSDVNSYIKTLLDSDEVMQNICMVGEVSNFKCHTSGHLYFSLKDDKCSIKAVMFASSYFILVVSKGLPFRLTTVVEPICNGWTTVLHRHSRSPIFSVMYWLNWLKVALTTWLTAGRGICPMGCPSVVQHSAAPGVSMTSRGCI